VASSPLAVTAFSVDGGVVSSLDATAVRSVDALEAALGLSAAEPPPAALRVA
jgi:hypothetical protein